MIDLETVVRALVMPLATTDSEVCRVCYAFIHEPTYANGLCENCVENTVALDGEITSITPITLYSRESEARTWTTHYKADIDKEHGESTQSRNLCISAMAQLVEQFFSANEWLLDEIEQVHIVPSTRRLPPHPLELVIRQTAVADQLVVGALSRTTEVLDHRVANAFAYRGDEALAGKRVLLIDDVYASGARLQSAAAAAQRAGAQVVRSVVVARRINPGFHPIVQAKWDEARCNPFRWARTP